MKIFHKLLEAPTVSEIARSKSSPAFNSLSDGAQATLTSIPDEKQFPAPAVQSGATLYGKNSSQAAEVNNKTVLAGRCLYVSQAVLWHADRLARLFRANGHAARAHTSFFLLAYAIGYFLSRPSVRYIKFKVLIRQLYKTLTSREITASFSALIFAHFSMTALTRPGFRQRRNLAAAEFRGEICCPVGMWSPSQTNCLFPSHIWFRAVSPQRLGRCNIREIQRFLCHHTPMC